MLDKLQIRWVAWLVTLCLVVVAILLGASTSLRAARNKAMEGFSSGSDVRGIQYDLDRIVADSYNLLTVADGYLDENDVVMDSVNRSILEVQTTGSVRAKYIAAQQLRQDISDLDLRLRDLSLDDTDRSYHNKLVININSHYKTIEQSNYNQTAAAFNQTLDVMPASILSQLVGVEPLELFA